MGLSWSLETARTAQRRMAMRTTNKAGSSRRARRDQNAPKLTRDDRPHSTRSSEVIRYPERTKKVSRSEENHEQTREQPPSPPRPERAEVDPRRPAPLHEEQRGDQIPGEDEEGVHPEEPAGHLPSPEVERDDRPDGHGPPAAQGGLVHEGCRE